MSQETELDLKFLERSLQQEGGARKAFFRDLKIATALLLAFQFMIFFLFVDINNQRRHLDLQVTKLRADQKALNEFQVQLASLEEALESGKEKLTKELKKTPSAKRERFLELDRDITRLRRSTPSSDAFLHTRSPSPAFVQQTLPIRQDSERSTFLEGLSVDDIHVLKTANPNETAFDDLVKRIVDERIIQPTFVALNSKKNELLEKPFSEKRSRLLTTLQSQRSTLEKYSLNTSGIDETMNQVQQNIQAFRFTAPASDLWWRTFSGKMREFEAMVIDTEKVVDQASQEFHKLGEDLAVLGKQLKTLIQEGEEEKQALNSQMQKLQSNFNQVQSRLENYTKPLPVVALDLKDAVLYYPAVLAVVFAYFMWNYVLLHRRARTLTATCRRLGLSNEILRLDIALPGFREVPQQGKTVKDYFPAIGFVLLFAVPGMFMALSLHKILASPGLRNEAPLLLYWIVSALFVISYLILVSRMLFPGHESQQ